MENLHNTHTNTHMHEGTPTDTAVAETVCVDTRAVLMTLVQKCVIYRPSLAAGSPDLPKR